MKTFSVVVFVFFSLVSVASAQTAAAPGVRIADAAKPTDMVIDAFIRCMEATKKEKTCRRLAEREDKRSEKVANEAADAAQAARPVVVDSPYGYGYRRRYYGGGYGCRWPCGY